MDKNILNYKAIISDSKKYNYNLITEELIPRYSSRKSFYQKATIIYPPKHATKLWNGVESILKSYETIVAIQLTNGTFYINGKWSPTTTSHQVEYAKQCDHDVNAVNITKYDLEK